MFQIFELFKNKKGASYVGLLVSSIIFFAIVTIAGNFKVYITKHKQNVIEYNNISQEINNHIANIYNENDWESLKDETISTNYGNILIKYGKPETTEFSTKRLNVTFEFKGELQTYELERSVYHE